MHVRRRYKITTQKCGNWRHFLDYVRVDLCLVCMKTVSAKDIDIKLADQNVCVLGQANVNVWGIFTGQTVL